MRFRKLDILPALKDGASRAVWLPKAGWRLKKLAATWGQKRE